ncbi:hypothetical protein H310_09785 [Aphanomyces invadans]|uniref:separase n=1 Tax=Aphanomyces invadans TaxID=157072 RepID=A0A024TSE1_9STRA|nr:hypothetical protein H310_09785 [Aphanomyces invadans]ETV96923.1 hypothetical protein H310_09785 [Aphanomyces invadans]|eukprot:XP_008874169.1 hypothetical protein H310_09785 [Aphanomyces invadans]
MEAVVKSLRKLEGDDSSKPHTLQALELFVSMHPSPKTLTVHAHFLERLVPSKDHRQRIPTPVPISKSPSLCLQGFQLALKNEDLPSLLLASLLVLNLNRDVVTFKQPFTWETMHLQLAKKLLDAIPQTNDTNNSLGRSLVWHHMCECLASLKFIPSGHDTTIEWGNVSKRLNDQSPLTPFLEKVVLVCLQVQLNMQEHTHLLPLSLPRASMTKITWDSCYRIIWKHASSITSPSIVYHLRKEGLRCLVHANSTWWVFVQQMYKAAMLYEKYSQAKQDALYCDFAQSLKQLHQVSPAAPLEHWLSVFLWLEHWVNNCINRSLLHQTLDLLRAECPHPSLLDMLGSQLTEKWPSTLVLPLKLPSTLIPLAFRNAKKVIDICPTLPALYNQLFEWSRDLNQPPAQQLLYLRLLIRACQDFPADALTHLHRGVSYVRDPAFAEIAERDWHLIAMKWFKMGLYKAVVDWCSVLSPHFPKCYLLLGLAHQKLLEWAMAVHAWEIGVSHGHVALDKFTQLLFNVTPSIGCRSLQSSAMEPHHADIAPLIAHQVESVWLVQCRKQQCSDSAVSTLKYGLALWEIVDRSSFRRRKAVALAEYFTERNPQALMDTYHTLIQGCPCSRDKWVLLVEQHLVARYACLPLQYFDAVEALYLIWKDYDQPDVVLQAGATLLGVTDLYEIPKSDQVEAAHDALNSGDYVLAESRWKQLCKESYQHAYALGLQECLVEPDDPSKMYLQLVHLDEFHAFATVLYNLQHLAKVYMATSRNKALLYLQYLQNLTKKLDMLPASRQISCLSIEFALNQGLLGEADAELSQLRANPVNESYHLKQSCFEDILHGDVHTLARTVSLATHAYKKAKTKSVPMYPKFQDILALVYRKLALNMPDPVLASQKATKLSLTRVDSRLAMQTLSHALRRRRTREALSQSMHSLQEAYGLFAETKRSIHHHPFCIEYVLTCLESLKYIEDPAMHVQIQWRMSWLLSGMPSSASGIVHDTTSFQKRWTSSAVPSDWNVLVLKKCNDSDLIVHRIQNNGASPVTVVLPGFAIDKFMKATALVIERSKDTLSGHTAEEAATWTSSQKKQWWKQRVHLDGQLKLLVDKALAHLSFYRCLLIPRPNPLPIDVETSIAAIFKRHPALSPMHQEIISSLMYTYATHLVHEDLVKEGLKFCGVPWTSQSLPRQSATMAVPPGLTLLSTNLHGFPWEGLFPPGFPVSRLHSMAPLFDGVSWSVSRQSVHYIVNPGGDLLNTATFLHPILTRGRTEWQWSTCDDPSDAASIFAKDVFLYCGHGSGERYIGRQVVEHLTKCPVALLMGCSSARLTPFGLYEPEGMLASYLEAKSPAVVGMLWDVTDRDLDRLSLALLETWFNTDASLCQALANARDECKLPCLNGLAAVCYGLPVVVKPGL